MTQTQPLLDTIVSPETQAKFTDAVASLAQSLGVAASHVYGVLVRQAVAHGIYYIVMAAGFATLAAICHRMYRTATAAHERQPSEGALAARVFTTIGTIVAIAIAFALVASATMRLINPEYYAIQEVLSLLR